VSNQLLKKMTTDEKSAKSNLLRYNLKYNIFSFKSSLNKNNALKNSALLIKKAPQVGLEPSRYMA